MNRIEPLQALAADQAGRFAEEDLVGCAFRRAGGDHRFSPVCGLHRAFGSGAGGNRPFADRRLAGGGSV